jgi:hypothetical protein
MMFSIAHRHPGGFHLPHRQQEQQGKSVHEEHLDLVGGVELLLLLETDLQVTRPNIKLWMFGDSSPRSIHTITVYSASEWLLFIQ